MSELLVVEEVRKVYEPPPLWLRPFVRSAVREPVEALRAVSFDLGAGEIVGLIGLNGAGKTTLIKIISTLLEPTDGRVTVDGFDVTEQPAEVCRRLGLVLEGDQGLYDRLTGHQNLVLYGVLAGMSRRASRARAGELLEVLELAHRDKLVFGYSAGMRMRLSIGRALMADPPLIVLDEPTRSLDPVASRFTSRLLRDLASEGRGILLSSHRLDEVVETCTHVAALVDGQLRLCGPPQDVADSSGAAATALSDLLEREHQVR